MLGRPNNTTDRGSQVDDPTVQSAAGLLELNRDVQSSRAMRLLATTNLSLYATLMERHLSGGVTPRPSWWSGWNATSTSSMTRSLGSR